MVYNNMVKQGAARFLRSSKVCAHCNSVFHTRRYAPTAVSVPDVDALVLQLLCIGAATNEPQQLLKHTCSTTTTTPAHQQPLDWQKAQIEAANTSFQQPIPHTGCSKQKQRMAVHEHS
jgi:hypothetical protein